MTYFIQCQGCGKVHRYTDAEGPTGGVFEGPGLCRACGDKWRREHSPAPEYRPPERPGIAAWYRARIAGRSCLGQYVHTPAL